LNHLAGVPETAWGTWIADRVRNDSEVIGLHPQIARKSLKKIYKNQTLRMSDLRAQWHNDSQEAQ